MANDLRSKLKATPIKKLKARIDEDNSMLNNGNAEFLSLEDGKLMKIRIFPAFFFFDNINLPRKNQHNTNTTKTTKHGIATGCRLLRIPATSAVVRYWIRFSTARPLWTSSRNMSPM